VTLKKGFTKCHMNIIDFLMSDLGKPSNMKKLKSSICCKNSFGFRGVNVLGSKKSYLRFLIWFTLSNNGKVD